PGSGSVGMSSASGRRWSSPGTGPGRRGGGWSSGSSTRRVAAATTASSASHSSPTPPPISSQGPTIVRLLHLLWPHLPLRLVRARAMAGPGSGSFPTGPLVLGGQPWTDGTVLDASPTARQLGVRRGMALGSAHRLAPEATFLDPDLAADTA